MLKPTKKIKFIFLLASLAILSSCSNSPKKKAPSLANNSPKKSLSIGVRATPNWVKNPLFENYKYRFYVGRASGKIKDSQRVLIQQATEDARESAIAENFGIFTSIFKRSYENMKSSSVVSRVSESSRYVILKKFRKKAQHIKTQNGRQYIWLLFQYPKDEILLEFQRLKNVDSTKPPLEFAQINASKSSKGGFLEILTVPQGVSISVDGNPYGVSPAKIRLDQGTYMVNLDHPHFESVEEQVVIQNDKSLKMNTVMLRARRKVHIQTEPEGASVELYGKYLGLSPVETIVPAGEKLGLLITHSETEPYRSNIEVEKGKDVYVIEVPPLRWKPSYVKINSTPKGAKVYLKDKFIGKTPTNFFQAKPGDKIKVLKNGYAKYTSMLEIKGGERRSLPSIKLIPKEMAFKNDPDIIRMAIESGNVNLLSLLIKNGTDVNTRDEDGKTPLELVIESNKKHMASMLIKNGADVNMIDQNGKTLLHRLISSDNVNMDMVSFLIEKQANVNVTSKDELFEGFEEFIDETPLFHDVVIRNSQCRLELTSLLIEKGVKVNQKDFSGKTVFHKIAEGNSDLSDSCLKTISLLLDNGLDSNIKDNEGKTPLSYIKDKSKRKKLLSMITKKKLEKMCDDGQNLGCLSLLSIVKKRGGKSPKAAQIYKRTCDKGDMKSCLELMLLIRSGQESKSHLRLSLISSFKKMCNRGEVLGCAMSELFSGNMLVARRLYQKSCNGGEMLGCTFLGAIEKKRGNLSQATDLYQKACEGGEMGGCFGLGSIEYKRGNLSQATDLFQKACEGGEMEGCLGLGFIEEKRGNLSQATDLYQKACEGGEMVGCSGLGFIEEKRGNLSQATDLYQKACEGGEMVGCFGLGSIEYKRGNLSQATDLYQKACEGGEMGGCLGLGFIE